MKWFAALAAVVLAICGWNYAHRPLTYPAGILISADPQQTVTTAAPIMRGDYQLKPLAHFAIAARVLHRKVYGWDRQSDLVPVDLALGWGAMSDQHVLDQVKITQSMRFYWFEYKLPPPISKDQIITHSTNVHVIPATAEIGSRCKSLRTGALIHLSGELVEATRSNGATWRSSLSRTDTGNGACELMLVQELSNLDADSLTARKVLVSR